MNKNVQNRVKTVQQMFDQLAMRLVDVLSKDSLESVSFASSNNTEMGED